MSNYVVVDKEQLEADLTTVADSIREKSGTTEDLAFPLGMKEVVESIDTSKPEQEKTIDITENGTTEVTPDEGKVLSKVTVNVDVESGGGSSDNEEWFRGWIERQNSCASLFANYQKATIPQIDFGNFQNATSCFANSKIEIIDYYLNFGEDKPTSVANMSNLFENTSELKKIVGLRSEHIINSSRLFYNSAIEEIQEPLNFTKVTDTRYGYTAFSMTSNLKEIRWVSETVKVPMNYKSTVLSDNSIQSIIDGLATVETAQTLTLAAEVKARLTETQISQITNKNWNLA